MGGEAMSYLNGTQDGVVRMIEGRKPGIIETTLRAGRRRAANIAAYLSRKGVMMGTAELCNEVIFKLIELAYETDDIGLCNVDPYTGVFERFPMPWGKQYRLYGLQRTEAAVLALHVARLQDDARLPPLWTYEPISRRWAVNIIDYPDRDVALAYWARVQLDANSYHLLSQEVRDRRSK